MRRALLFSPALIVMLAAVVLARWPKEQKRSELIDFSHRIHVGIRNIECQQCHVDIMESTRANQNNLPKQEEACAKCHNIFDPADCGICHKQTDPSEFIPFVNPPRTVEFHHKYHLTVQNLDCAVCHGIMAETDYADPEVNLPKMSVCGECHNAEKAPLECAWCHLEEDNLRPEFHTASWLHDHRTWARLGEQSPDERCEMCHTMNWCQECHDGVQVVIVNDENVSAPYAPASWGRKPQMIARVHEIDYRFTHPLDAKGKERECSTCHEITQFCIECHRTEAETYIPQWHQGMDWAPSAFDGGRHEEFARRDIERCIACHDLQGEEPVCARCHIDNR